MANITVFNPRGGFELVPEEDAEAYRSWAQSQAQSDANRPATSSQFGVPIHYTSYNPTGYNDFLRERQATAKNQGSSFDLSKALTQISSQGNSAYQDTLNRIKEILPQFSKQSAMEDARALIESQAIAEREKNMPALQRAVEGAGTSASSMQALLSQKFITDTARAAQAAGAEQAKAYGGITSSLSGALASLVASGDPQQKLLADILQTQMQSETAREVSKTGASASITGASIGANASRANAATAAASDKYRADLSYQGLLKQLEAQAEASNSRY